MIYFDRKEIGDAFLAYFHALWSQDTEVRRGADAVKDMWMESLQYGELKFIGARGYFVDQYPELFEEIKQEAEKIPHLKWKNVVDIGAKDHPLNTLPWMEVRFPLQTVPNPNVVWLWGTKVAIANWTEDEPILFISTNKYLVQLYTDYFNLLWNQGSN